ncbi:cathepsin like thiol protease membrane associated [Cryptosporidium sp. chipmunk genotype I]|uniref:cathepsin like thiol protease membrane associated n=1 Tax=Cryptosporidium sp. chipmunk genotype I TaxID=1280935 RepID=UPI00351A8140|nr:cathepsin like thiol protease membrane associated [Cryptosporidium sp. chipmunk genotype I]
MQIAFPGEILHFSNKSCGKKRNAFIIFLKFVGFVSLITKIHCNLLYNGNHSIENNEFGVNHALSQEKNVYSVVIGKKNETDTERYFLNNYSSQESSTKIVSNGIKGILKKGFQSNANIFEENNSTSKFFNPFEFNFSLDVYQCVSKYEELKKYLQKISLIFYLSNRTHELENEDLNNNSSNIWKIENDKVSNTTIKMNIATNSGEVDNHLDILIHPGIFVKSVHRTSITWIDRLLDISNINSIPMNLLNLTNNQDNSKSIINCICIFVSEVQINLGLNRSSLEGCNIKIQEIIAAIKSNPEAKFELTQLSLNRPPSKLVVPKNLRNKVTGSSWKESIAEGKELLSENLFGRSEHKLEFTYNTGSEILRQLSTENPRIDDKSGETNEARNENLYFDSRDVNGESCVYIPFDQGKCGGCYAFVVSASISISNCIQKSELPAPLSPQQIIDCSESFGNLGCDGGFYSNGWSYLLEQNVPRNYICSWDEYPYIDSLSSCKANVCNGCLSISKYNVFTGLALNGDDGWDFVTTILPKVGSISLSINSDLPGFSSYSDGIYRAPKCTTFSELNHAVIMVGFGINNNGDKYYVIQNSWGASWGIGGFMNVSANSCDMFWYPGIIRQASQESMPDECKGNKLLLTGPGEVNKVQKNSKAYNIFVKKPNYGIYLLIYILLLLYL